MNELTITNQDGILVADSRDVAKMIDMRHSDLLEKIKGYIKVLLNGNFRSADFFIESSYQDSTGRTLPCYKITKKGCDMVANKLTGEKGIIFTATYVTKFEEMEKALKQPKPITQIEALLQSVQILAEQEKRLKALEEKQQTLQYRIENLDATNIEGDLQQRLNKLVRKYAFKAGIMHNIAWEHFKQAYNTAYRTNLELLINNYKEREGIKKLTLPQYLAITGHLEDAIRVADKMLNDIKTA